MTIRRLAALASLAIVASATLVVGASPAAAASYSLHVVSPIEGRIGIDGLYAPDDGNGYDVLT